MSASDVIAVVGIILSFAVMFVLVYKGMHVVWATFISSIILIITNGLQLFDTIGLLFTAWGEAIPTFAPVVLFGAVFSKVMDYTGAAKSFATTLYHSVVPKNATDKKRRMITIIVTIILEVILVYSGIDQFAIVFIMMPILGVVCEEVNIPRRYLPAMILSAAGIACATPGCANVSNTIPMQLAGSTSMGGMIPGFIGAIVILIGVCFYLVRAINKSVEQGEHFEWGKVLQPPAGGDKTPHFILSIIPFIVVIVGFNILKLECQYAIALATIVALILMYQYIPVREGSEVNLKTRFTGIYDLMLEGLMSIAPIMLIFLSTGFASVISSCKGYEILVNAVLSISLPPAITFGVIMLLLVGIMINPVGAMMVAIPFAMTAFPDMNPAAIHRISSFAYIVLDSLPFAAGIIVAQNMAGLTQKEAYKPMFFTTVVWAFVGFAIVVAMFAIFPGWR